MPKVPTTAAGDRLSVRDLITIGLLSLLLMILIMVMLFVLYLFPPTFPLMVAIAAIPGGIIGMLLLARAGKPGAVIVWGTTLALMMLVMGYGFISLAILVAMAIVGELLWRSLGRDRFVAMAVAYGFIMSGFATANYAIYAFMEGAAAADIARGHDPTALAAATRLITPQTLPILALISFGGAWLGAMWGRRVLRKHFERAGKV